MSRHTKHRKSRVPTSVTMPRFRASRVVMAALALGLVLCIVWARSQAGPRLGSDIARYHDRTFHVVRIVDGDTLVIDAPDTNAKTTKIRLWGVDCPEVGHGDQPAMLFGPEATDYARQLLEGRDVHLTLMPDRTRGKYGRLLAYVWLERGGRMFNELLLEDGYAYADLRFTHVHQRRFERIEKRARSAGLGLWASPTPDDWPGWKRRIEAERSEQP